MAPTRRMSNGRSPLVNQQSQITAFFSKTSSSPSLSPSPSPSPSPVLSKQDLNPKPSPSPSPSPSPTTPSPVQAKLRKPLLVIGPSKTTSPSTPVTGSKSYGEEVVNRRVKVYWPLDKSWYVGCVKSFDELTGEHLVQYDDADEETLDLGKEKIEWVEDKGRSLRRLRRGSVFEKGVVPVGEANVEEESGGDDSSDEDWGKGKGREEVEDDSEDVEFEEEEDEEEEVEGPKKGQSKKVDPKKRKAVGEGTMGSGKRRKSSGGAEKNTFKVSILNAESK